MSNNLKEIILGRFQKIEMLNLINSVPNNFSKLIEYSLSDEEKFTWRAAWLINQTMEYNDIRLLEFVEKFILEIKNKKDGLQREILKIIEKMDISDDILGNLFDECVFIWKDVDKIPSVRITAFRIILNISKKYNEFVNEIEIFLGEEYSKSLSAGIKNSFFDMKKQLLALKYKI